jgi:hypothetical protein
LLNVFVVTVDGQPDAEIVRLFAIATAATSPALPKGSSLLIKTSQPNFVQIGNSLAADQNGDPLTSITVQ